MTLYESNYIRLRQLLGDVLHLPDNEVSASTTDSPLHVRVDERSRYTTTFTLTYEFTEGADVISDPDLQVRIYHDACLGEALRCARWHRHPVIHELNVGARLSGLREMDDRWQRNIMLNKWLEYCLDRGHSFAGRRERR
jgi:uncharacterized protein YqiB (DUF1249 family)